MIKTRPKCGLAAAFIRKMKKSHKRTITQNVVILTQSNTRSKDWFRIQCILRLRLSYFDLFQINWQGNQIETIAILGSIRCVLSDRIYATKPIKMEYLYRLLNAEIRSKRFSLRTLSHAPSVQEVTPSLFRFAIISVGRHCIRTGDHRSLQGNYLLSWGFHQCTRRLVFCTN